MQITARFLQQDADRFLQCCNSGCAGHYILLCGRGIARGVLAHIKMIGGIAPVNAYRRRNEQIGARNNAAPLAELAGVGTTGVRHQLSHPAAEKAGLLR